MSGYIASTPPRRGGSSAEAPSPSAHTIPGESFADPGNVLYVQSYEDDSMKCFEMEHEQAGRESKPRAHGGAGAQEADDDQPVALCIKLIDYSCERERIGVTPVAHQHFSAWPTELKRDPLALVSIIGTARQGKSTLMNKLVQGHAFETSDSGRVCTQGVDVALDTVGLPNGTRMLFLDCEGQGDKGKLLDAKLAVPVLLSSTVVLVNWTGPPLKDHMLNMLGFIVTAAQCIDRTRREAEDAESDDGSEEGASSLFGHLNIVFRDQVPTEENYQLVEEVLFTLEDEDVSDGSRPDREDRNRVRRLLDQVFASTSATLLPNPFDIRSGNGPEAFDRAAAALRADIHEYCGNGALQRFNGRPLHCANLLPILDSWALALNKPGADGVLRPTSVLEAVERSVAKARAKDAMAQIAAIGKTWMKLLLQDQSMLQQQITLALAKISTDLETDLEAEGVREEIRRETNLEVFSGNNGAISMSEIAELSLKREVVNMRNAAQSEYDLFFRNTRSALETSEPMDTEDFDRLIQAKRTELQALHERVYVIKVLPQSTASEAVDADHAEEQSPVTHPVHASWTTDTISNVNSRFEDEVQHLQRWNQMRTNQATDVKEMAERIEALHSMLGEVQDNHEQQYAREVEEPCCGPVNNFEDDAEAVACPSYDDMNGEDGGQAQPSRDPGHGAEVVYTDSKGRLHYRGPRGGLYRLTESGSKVYDKRAAAADTKTIHTGPRGGRFTYDAKGKKRYFPKEAKTSAKSSVASTPSRGQAAPAPSRAAERTIHTGARGGKFYLTATGNRVYLKGNTRAAPRATARGGGGGRSAGGGGGEGGEWKTGPRGGVYRETAGGNRVYRSSSGGGGGGSGGGGGGGRRGGGGGGGGSRTVHTGPRGGRYTISSSGKKRYI